jgi:hypothetical protein
MNRNEQKMNKSTSHTACHVLYPLIIINSAKSAAPIMLFIWLRGLIKKLDRIRRSSPQQQFH